MTAQLQLSHLSREFVLVPVVVVLEGETVDPTEDPVEFAFPAPGEDPETWIGGTWEEGTDGFLARCLVGPGGSIELDPGRYRVWVRFTDEAEVPVKEAGTLVVT